MNRLAWPFWVVCSFIMLGANWPNWRGPNLDGVAPPGEYPTKWSATENVAWKVALPGRGASTPVVWDRRIYLTYGKDSNNVLGCIDWGGKTVWETTVGKEQPRKKPKASGCNPSVITDGNSLFAYFKSGDLACIGMDGKVIWQTNLQQNYGENSLWWDLGTSPVLTKNCVVVAVMQTGPSFLVALDKKSGDVVWKQDRMVDAAPPESAQSYTTPLVAQGADGKEVIYVLGADHITAHAGDTGAELWRVGELNPAKRGNFRSIASPVISGELLIAPYERGDSLTAVRLGGSGNVTKSHVAWTIREKAVAADVPTPAVQGGHVYICTDRGEVARLDANTGKQIWRNPLETHRAPYSSSPMVAGGHIYLTREDGKTFVLKDGDQFQLVGANQLPDEDVVATPVFLDGRILIRTPTNLYCIGKP